MPYCGIGIFTIVVFVVLVSGRSQGPPKDENGNIICSRDDPYCEKFRQMLEPQPYRFRQNSYGDLEAFNKGSSGGNNGGQSNFRCDGNPFKKLICEKMGKTCYTDGRCGDLVQEEQVKSV